MKYLGPTMEGYALACRRYPKSSDPRKFSIPVDDFGRVYLPNANLKGACLAGCFLQRATLRGASLELADLSRACLRDADLRGALFHNVKLRNASLSGTDLSGANLQSADLQGADLQGADLQGADLYMAKLSEANLTGANLTGANLTGADLYGADLTAANLNKTTLWDESIEGAPSGHRQAHTKPRTSFYYRYAYDSDETMHPITCPDTTIRDIRTWAMREWFEYRPLHLIYFHQVEDGERQVELWRIRYSVVHNVTQSPTRTWYVWSSDEERKAFHSYPIALEHYVVRVASLVCGGQQ